MKKFKNLFLYCITTIIAFTFLIAPFSCKKTSNNANAESSVIQTELIDQNVLNYVNISTSSQKLTLDNIKSIDTDNDGVNDTSYIFANGTISLSFNLDYNYTFDYEESYFYDDSNMSTHRITVQEATAGLNTVEYLGKYYPNNFEYNGKTYYFMFDSNNTIHIYENQTSIPSSTTAFAGNDLITCGDYGMGLEIYFTTKLTLKSSSPNTTFKFSPFKYGTASQYNYIINFKRTIADFSTEDVISFTCTGHDVGETIFTNPKIERELSYKNVILQFTNNNYTEINPLYFDINYNGFLYTFKLYCKTISSNDYLFVEYFDTKKSNHNQSLATKINSTSGSIDTPVYKYSGDPANNIFNIFNLTFNKTGRYEISVYDSTYVLGLKKCNYYSTSFYIKNETSSAFDNAYAIMQGYDDEGNFLDYIVSDSTQNTNVKILVKNLLYYFEHDEIIKNISTDENIKDLQVLEFIKTTLTGSLNIPVSTFYTVEQLKELLENKRDSQDFELDCTDDAFYEVNIFKFNDNQTVDGDSNVIHNYTVDKTKTRSYQFTIVKQPKISFTVYDVDEDYDPIPIPDSSKYSTSIHEADTPYIIDVITYHININSGMALNTNFSANIVNFEKTYVNEYSIQYAMQEVKVEEFDMKEGDEVLDQLNLKFYGIGEIKVTITANGTTTNYTLESGDSLTFKEYGTYSVSFVDSMGTKGTGTFTYSKPTSVSSLLLIGLAGLIVVVIVLFIISSRGKVATR